MRYAADFETTTKAPASVWAWALCPVDNPGFMKRGIDLDSFFECSLKLKAPTIYFHNAKFDFSFIIYYLMTHGYTWIEDREQRADKTFRVLVSLDNIFFSAEIYIKKRKNLHKITIWDSSKLFRMSLAEIAECFKLPMKKGHIDYDRHNEPCEITAEEWSYIDIDVKILALALAKALEAGLDRMTIGSCALNDYKKLIGRKRFDYLFPKVNIDDDNEMRKAFRGAFVLLNPEHKAKEIGRGIVLDTNGLYSYILATKALPYGMPVKFEGEYQANEDYPLWIQSFRCGFRLKKGKLPTLQLKYDPTQLKTEYIYTTAELDDNGEPVYQIIDLCMTNVDMIFFFENYEIVTEIQWLGGYMFKSSSKLFTDWIAKWDFIKEEASQSGNLPLRYLAKLIVNNLYGKFSQNPKIRNKRPEYNPASDRVEYLPYKYEVNEETGELQEVELEKIIDPVYIPVGIFITAWGRHHTLKAAQMCHNKGRFIYSDTDSLHLLFDDIPGNLPIDPYKLGFWKIEKVFDRAYYLCPKRYVLQSFEGLDELKKLSDKMHSKPHYKPELRARTFSRKSYRLKPGKLKVVCAGMPDRCKKAVSFSNFRSGRSYDGLLKQIVVTGGTILQEEKFTLTDPMKNKKSKG